MPDPQLDQLFQKDPHLQLAAQTAGALPTVPLTSVLTPFQTVDANVVAAELFGLSLTGSRDAILTALRNTTRVTPAAVTAEGQVIVPAGGPASSTAIARPGEAQSPASVSAQMLDAQVTLLSGIKPLEPCGGDRCGVDTIVSLVRGDTNDLVSYLAKPRPAPQQVDLALSMRWPRSS